MVLPEIVGGLVPVLVVGPSVAADFPIMIPVGFEKFIQTVVSAQSQFVEVFIGAYPIIDVHAVIIITGSHTIPGLSCLFKVAYILVAKGKCAVIVEIGKSSIITAGTA